ncbi:MAG: site-specific integrase [Clostridiales bacterium]|nr:site-specific integrase [Clostridiales bacterium]
MPDIAGDIKPPKVPKRRVNILSAEDISRLDRSVKCKPTNYETGVLIGEYTGARLGELCALRWGDIDFHTQLIHIHATVQRLPKPKGTGQKTGLEITDPKTAGSDRFIPIPLQIIPVLKEASKGKDSEVFIMTGQADKCLDPRTCQYRWKRLLKRLNIEYVNFHVLRHTFATTAIKKGMDAKNLSEILGHSSVKITLERYVHPTMDMKREQMNRLDFSVT